MKGTLDRGITFTSKHNSNLEAFLQFPLNPNALLPLTDANWGSQDQRLQKGITEELPRFKTRSMSGFVIFFNGPLHWNSKRQRITARSSAEAEIYATDECVKQLLHLKHMFTDMNITSVFLQSSPITVYNDNNACVCWSKSTPTKGLRYITVRDNAIRESVDDGFIEVKHIASKPNIADIFTKEMRDNVQFKILRDHLVQPSPKISWK